MEGHDNKIIRAPSLKRGKIDETLGDRIKLKKVLGITVCSNAALDYVQNQGIWVYPAGCTVVFLNVKQNSQEFILNTSKKAITSIAVSKCGRYLATGECGINPSIKVWELDFANENNVGTLIAEFLGHKYAVSCVAFSPTGRHLVSIGSQHDMIINVFDWKANLKIASNKVSAKVSAVCFSGDGNYFVTVGNRHVKYWYLKGNRKYKEPIPLMGRSAILGELHNNDFCAVACGIGECSDSTYAITRIGHLVEFNSRRLLDKYVACRTNSANCISVNSNYILVGCAEAIIRIFNSLTLEYITTLPRTHYLGVDVAQGIHINHIMAAPTSAKYPDTIAMVFDETRNKVVCVYNDHSLYIWDLRDMKRVGKSKSYLYHSACIWGVENVPCNSSDNDENNTTDSLPEECFLTCSSDDTIRVWGLDGCDDNTIYRKNIYSKELLKILYIDNELTYIKDSDNSILNSDKNSSYDGRNGVRCIKICQYQNHLATGDRSGNIRIYSIDNLKLITLIEAHDSEVLCLEYTNGKYDRRLLASASRDRLIHVFDVEKNYQIVQTLDDHSSSITSVKFVSIDGQLEMISCGADKSIMFRYFQGNQFLKGINCSGKTTLYDMEIDSNRKHVLTACQDRNIRIYGTQNAKHTKTFRGSLSEDGSLIKLCLDPSGIYVATSCTDKTLSVYDYYSSECMAKMYGHSELVTGLKFSNDCQYLISASGDGCIFIWQMPHDMVVTMQARLSQQRLRFGNSAAMRNLSSPLAAEVTFDNSPTIEKDNYFYGTDTLSTSSYKFSEVGQLPLWAKRKGSNTDDSNPNISKLNTLNNSNRNIGISKPRGRWAERGQQIENDNLIRNTESPSNINVHNVQTSDYNSGSSKEVFFSQNNYLSEDSSIDSGMDAKKDIFSKKKILLGENKIDYEPNKDHEGDIEDLSDGERPNSDIGFFYPNQSQASPMDFKVNAMNEDELRKSARKQKFEKVKLNLTGLTTTTVTASGTSDTEDERSTPSGDNAERSLRSLGGSFENIPQQSTYNFLQAALDGPSLLNDRSERTRKSISAKHNIENKNLPKSYTNSKKEELMKVINDAKQKLETVGYRSNLRGSQSISDLTHFTESSQPSRISKQGFHYETSQEDCILLSESKIWNPPIKSQQPYFDKGNNKKLLYKNLSCPVSPVHNKQFQNFNNIENDEQNKQNSIFSYDAKIIIDTIHSDTEKMIKEIEQKYTDLNNFYPKKCNAKKLQQISQLKEEEANFSSDSLEDCCFDVKYCKTVSSDKKQIRQSKSDFCLNQNTRNRNISLSEILDFDENNSSCYGKNYNNNCDDEQLSTSPSFFLINTKNRKKNSEENIMMMDELNMSNFNSMESILSDESDCKSAPLEVLFNYIKRNDKNIDDYTSKSYGSSPNSICNFDKYTKDKNLYLLNNSRNNCLTNNIPLKDDIPTLKIKNIQYISDVKKSLSKEFSNQRQQQSNLFRDYNNSEFDNLFTKKDINLKNMNIVKNSSSTMKKSCSYEISLNNTSIKQQISNDNNSMLARTLELNYVPHKPPVANKRSSSMRSKNKPKKIDNKLNYDNFEKRNFVATTTNDEISVKQKLIPIKKNIVNINNKSTERNSINNGNKQQIQQEGKENVLQQQSPISLKQSNFQEIKRKIGEVNDLLEIEDVKFKNECSSNSSNNIKDNNVKSYERYHSNNNNCIGYVKSLTMNFDKLARSIKDEIEYERSRNIKIKRNHSLPDVLEGANFSTENLYGFDKGNTRTSKFVTYDESSIRRACSLSDLCFSKGTVAQNSQIPTPAIRVSGTPSRTTRKNNSQAIKNNTSMNTRSSSVGILHQVSDSDTDSRMCRNNLSKVSSLSRNISSSGQTRLSANTNIILPRRKSMQSSYSSVNLSTGGIHEDSSSEEISSGPSYKNGKPFPSIRQKNLVPDNRLLPTTNIPNISKIRETVDLFSFNQIDTTNAPPELQITSQMCSNVISMLNTTTSAVLQLHTRLKSNRESSSISRNNHLMLIELENAAIMTQNMLTKITETTDNGTSSSLSNTKYLEGQSSAGDTADYILMMNNCAEIIKNLSKIRMENQLIESDENKF